MRGSDNGPTGTLLILQEGKGLAIYKSRSPKAILKVFYLLRMQPSMTDEQDLYFMGLALEEARRAESLGEVPIGAVVVKNGQVIGRGCNRVIESADPTAHAEIEALRDACQDQDNYRLTETTLYTTLEPCLMCFGALVHARISRIVYGAKDPKGGYQLNMKQPHELNHHPHITSGVRGLECSSLLSDFFKERRH